MPATSALDPDVPAGAHDALIETLRALIRIPSVNPPDPERADAEMVAARWIGDALEDAGLAPELHEPVPGRGSVTARLRGDGSRGDALLLLGHLDVVPAATGSWTHDPFGADLVDGYVWGRGAVDMKDLVAMEMQVLRILAARARAAGRDPATDPIPGLGRDILFACTADEEAGGRAGAGWIADHRPELLRAAGAVNESGGIATQIAGRTIYPIQVAEKGYAVYRITVHGTWGHGSMPRDDNALLLAAEAARRLSRAGSPRQSATMRRFLDELLPVLPPAAGHAIRALAGDDPRLERAALDRMCDPSAARAFHALLRDTISPDVLHAGVKYNVIPGEATIEVDCRVLPDTSEPAMREQVVERLGDLASRCSVELIGFGPPIEGSPETELYAAMAATVRDHDPDGIPIPAMAPFGTDAKHLVRLGVPCYGFSPLRLEPGERYLERFHGVDERVGVEALRWGLPVLLDLVTRYCATAR